MQLSNKRTATNIHQSVNLCHLWMTAYKLRQGILEWISFWIIIYNRISTLLRWKYFNETQKNKIAKYSVLRDRNRVRFFQIACRCCGLLGIFKYKLKLQPKCVTNIEIYYFSRRILVARVTNKRIVILVKIVIFPTGQWSANLKLEYSVF